MEVTLVAFLCFIGGASFGFGMAILVSDNWKKGANWRGKHEGRQS